MTIIQSLMSVPAAPTPRLMEAGEATAHGAVALAIATHDHTPLAAAIVEMTARPPAFQDGFADALARLCVAPRRP